MSNQFAEFEHQEGLSTKMERKFMRRAGLLLALSWSSATYGATFGRVVPVHGEVADIALDQSRGRLYAANLTSYRVEVINTANNQLLTPISVPIPPSSVAVSPDNRFLVIGEYYVPDPKGNILTPATQNSGGLTLVNLASGARTQITVTSPVLTVAFGSDGLALVITLGNQAVPDVATLVPNAYVFNPATLAMTSIPSPSPFGKNLGVPLATFPTQIIRAASGVAGDGNTIYVMTAVEDDEKKDDQSTFLFRYTVSSQSLSISEYGTSPPLGPRSIAVNSNGTGLVMSWTLLRLAQGRLRLFAQFPKAKGIFHQGSSAWDTKRNLIYSNMPADNKDAVLNIADTDNLTIRERIQLPELLSGKSVLNSDSSIMYSVSQSGVMVLPVGAPEQTPRVGSVQEDLLFLADSCNRFTSSQDLNIVSLGSAAADFTLSLPKETRGVTLSSTTGRTPAVIRVSIDAAAFQGVSGTTSIPITITSNAAVNLPPAVRLLINTRDFNQRGSIINVPGKLVDILADVARNRLYILRQDKNLVLVYEGATQKQIGTMRTGNTPTHMALTVDGKFLLVANDNSQIANVLDLDTLTASEPILFPGGHYPRSLGVTNASNSDIFALVRAVGNYPPGTKDPKPPALIDHVDFSARLADTPSELNGGQNPSVYENRLETDDGVIVSTPDRNFLMLALADGNLAQYDSSALAWTVSRKDFESLDGPYAALNGNLFIAGANSLNAGLVSLSPPFEDAKDQTAAGTDTSAGWGIRTLATDSWARGIIARFDLTNRTEYSRVFLAEAPLTKTTLRTPQIGQIGQTILSFTRTLAVLRDQSIFALTASGFTAVSANFDTPAIKPVIQSITNPADGRPAIGAGGRIMIAGIGFTTRSLSAPGYPLPLELGEVCVTVNDAPIPLFDVSAGSVTAQLPFLTLGQAKMVAKGPGGISDPFAVNIAATAPAIFYTSGGTAGIFRNDNGEFVTFTNPIHHNQAVSIFLTGLGPVSPALEAGQEPPSDPPAVPQIPVVTLGSVTGTVTSVYLVPGLAGAYQVNVALPGTSPGPSVPLTVRQGGASTSVNVRVVNP